MKAIFTLLLCLYYCFALAVEDSAMAFADSQIEQHPQLSGAYVLNRGADALMTRAWLAQHAQHTIEVQYFIWSTDNIGILASEALLSAADRGVKVRVIVDDLLIDAPDKTLLALAKHKNIQISIYNPKHSVGTTFYKRILNLITDFRGANQRMHDKTFIVDGKVAITGGRNMAAEYFDYHHRYNFRDRDVLLLGEVVKTMQTSFNQFWQSDLSHRVESLYDGNALMEAKVSVSSKETQKIYADLHSYAKQKEHFSPEVSAAIDAIANSFPSLAKQVVWGDVTFISDYPGKNKQKISLGGGGRTSSSLAKLVEGAKQSIIIQSPYLVMSDTAKTLFKQAINRGVKVRINTNSMASTDNLMAFSGYRNQRQELLKMGVEIFEFKPHPEEQYALMQDSFIIKQQLPIFAIHAKGMVVDNQILYIGTFNFDPRSENLNTEVGAIITNKILAKEVADAIAIDMDAKNSWHTATDNPDQYADWVKRLKVGFLQIMPIKALL
jgi:cardiolipin synthase C